MGGDGELVYRVGLWGVAFGVVGARLYHVVTRWSLVPDPKWEGVFEVWNGGLGIWGGVLFGCNAGALVVRRAGASARSMLDAAAPGLLLAQGIGRWGNWWNHSISICTGVYELAGGTLVGTTIDRPAQSMFHIAVTGGTGRYEGASGSILSVSSSTGYARDFLRALSCVPRHTGTLAHWPARKRVRLRVRASFGWHTARHTAASGSGSSCLRWPIFGLSGRRFATARRSNRRSICERTRFRSATHAAVPTCHGPQTTGVVVRGNFDALGR